MRCAGIAVAGAVLTLSVRRQSGEFAVLAGLAAVVALGMLGLQLLEPVLSFLKRLQQQSGLSSGTVGVVLRTVSIGLITETGETICTDAGEKSIAAALRYCGTAAAIYTLLPLLEGVLNLMEKLL